MKYKLGIIVTKHSELPSSKAVSNKKTPPNKVPPTHLSPLTEFSPEPQHAEQEFINNPLPQNLKPAVARQLQRKVGNHALTQAVRTGTWLGNDDQPPPTRTTGEKKIQRIVSTPAVFINDMGSAPKTDSGSRRYKQIITALVGYHAAVLQSTNDHTHLQANTAKIADERGPAAVETLAKTSLDHLLKSLRDLVTACESYLAARTDTLSKATSTFTRFNPLSKPNPAKEAARRQKITVVTNLKAAANADFNLPLFAQLSQLQHYRKTLSGDFTDTNRQGESTPLGTGVNNTAYSVRYQIGANAFDGVFKAEPEGQHSDASESAGIPLTNSRGNYRAVAMHRLEQLFQTGVIPRTGFATKGGQFGQVMERARGKSPVIMVAREGNENDLQIRMAMRWMHNVRELEAKKDLTSSERENLEEYKVDIKKSPAQFVNGQWILNESKFRDLDVRDPLLQQGLSNLQVIDIVSGQVDRHPGNYFIEVTAGRVTKVTAIDNDIAFGKNHTNVTQIRGHLVALPEVVDHTLAMRIVGDVNNPTAGITADQVAAAVQDLLTAEEIAALRTRFTAVKDKLRSLIQNNQTATMDGAGGTQQWGAGQVAGFNADRYAERSYMARLNNELNIRRPANMLVPY